MIPLDVSSSKAIGVRMAETCETAEEEHIPDGVKVFFPLGQHEILHLQDFLLREIYHLLLGGLERRSECLVSGVGVIPSVRCPVKVWYTTKSFQKMRRNTQKSLEKLRRTTKKSLEKMHQSAGKSLEKCIFVTG